MRVCLQKRLASIGFLVLLSLILVVAAGCGSSGSTGAGGGTSTAAGNTGGGAGNTGGGGTVKVLYAGSLTNIMENSLGPAYEQNTNNQFQGFGTGSRGLAQKIKSGARQGDIFISADPSVNEDVLMGQSNGNLVSWYATFAQAPLVVGYNPQSKFAEDFESKPWYEVLTEPGIKVGRTDPKTDPKGKKTVNALKQVAERLDRPRLDDKILDNSTILPEEDLVGRLQSGQLDAGFFYSIETSELDLSTVPIKKSDIGAMYTVTILNQAQNQAGAIDFIQFLLEGKGKAILKDRGFKLIMPPKISGDKSEIPDKLRPTLGIEQ